MDLISFFIVFLLHIRTVLTEKLDAVRISLPISATGAHFTFMQAAARCAFREQTIEFTTEPEAAFNHVMCLVDESAFSAYNQILLADGGDGTFDYLFVKRFGEVWSKQFGRAFANAGSVLLQKLRRIMNGLAGNGPELLNRQCFQLLVQETYRQLKLKTGSVNFNVQHADVAVSCAQPHFVDLFPVIRQEAAANSVFTVLYEKKPVTCA